MNYERMLGVCGPVMLSVLSVTLARDIPVGIGVPRVMYEDEIQSILDKHHYYRRLQHAKDMSSLTYHLGLEQQVKDWLDTCHWGHGWAPSADYGMAHWPQTGQNLWMSTGAFDETEGRFAIEGALDAWYNEIANYDTEAHTCTANTVCGHFTQMVWAKSTHIGCAYKYCENIERDDGTTGVNRHIFGCNYGPSGNYVGAPAFINGVSGEECTECHNGYSECDDGLCHRCSETGGDCECKAQCHNCGTAPAAGDECRCTCASGWFGPSCQTTCDNHHVNCGDGWWKAQCVDMDPSWDPVRVHCLALCSFCDASPVSTGCAVDTANYAITGPTAAPPEDETTTAAASGMTLTFVIIVVKFVHFL